MLNKMQDSNTKLFLNVFFSFLLFFSILPLRLEADASDLYAAKVEAHTCSLQIDVVTISIIQHTLSGLDQSLQICFDLGQLATYLKLFDLSLDTARDEIMKYPVEDRIKLRWPFMHREELLGVCGVGMDTSLVRGDFKGLLSKLSFFKEQFNFIEKRLRH